MTIKVNTDARNERIQKSFDIVIKEIKQNAEAGNPCTIATIDKDIASDVRALLEKEVKGIEFCVNDRRPNPHTGQMQYFTGLTIGDIRYYKIKIIE